MDLMLPFKDGGVSRWIEFRERIERENGVDVESNKLINECGMRLIESFDQLEKAGVLYAGSYVDAERGTYYIGLVEPAENHRELILQIMKPDTKITIVFYEAEFTLKQLEEAKLKLRPYLKSLPITSTDAEEVMNKLVVGLSELRDDHIAAILDVVGRNIDVIFKQEKAISYSKSDYHRPVYGGYRIETESGASTLGFAAIRDGNRGFVMTGHAGGVGTAVYQPTEAPDNFVGYIDLNPPRPRHSDAAWNVYNNVYPAIYSEISETGYNYVEGYVPSYNTHVGDAVSMQGIASCGVSGTITEIGADIGDLHDQVLANFPAATGDSGAPTYAVTRLGNRPDYPHYVKIYGILSGRVCTWWCIWLGDAFYSPIEAVMTELAVTVLTI